MVVVVVVVVVDLVVVTVVAAYTVDMQTNAKTRANVDTAMASRPVACSGKGRG